MSARIVPVNEIEVDGGWIISIQPQAPSSQKASPTSVYYGLVAGNFKLRPASTYGSESLVGNRNLNVLPNPGLSDC